MGSKRKLISATSGKAGKHESDATADGPSGAEGVRLAWELSLEQWALHEGHGAADQPMQKSVVVLTRRSRACAGQHD